MNRSSSAEFAETFLAAGRGRGRGKGHGRQPQSCCKERRFPNRRVPGTTIAKSLPGTKALPKSRDFDAPCFGRSGHSSFGGGKMDAERSCNGTGRIACENFKRRESGIEECAGEAESHAGESPAGRMRRFTTERAGGEADMKGHRPRAGWGEASSNLSAWGSNPNARPNPLKREGRSGAGGSRPRHRAAPFCGARLGHLPAAFLAGREPRL
jgi:hypothetical protein